MVRIVLCGLFPETVVMFGSLPAKVGPLLPVAVAIFELPPPLAGAIFLVIWQLHPRRIAIFVEVVEFVPQCHRKPQWKKTQHQFSAVSGAATMNFSHPPRRWLVFYFWPWCFGKVASKTKPPGLYKRAFLLFFF